MLRQAFDQIRSQFWGWKTDRKLLIFESDDWGSLYLPNSQQIKTLERVGVLKSDRQGYKRYDCLETRDDLECLFDLLNQFSDLNGNPAKFTFNTVMGNPDFDKIKASEFQVYFHQFFFDSYRQYNGEDCRRAWQLGMANRLFTPQFHAHEHLNVPRWMRDLRGNRQDTRIAFENQYYCQSRSMTSPVDYLTAHWPDTIEDLVFLEKQLLLGLAAFETTFQFPSKTFVACCYVLPQEIEKVTADNGVGLIQTQRRHRVPLVHSHQSTFRSRYPGQKNQFGQIYSVRTVQFEPFSDNSLDWADLAFKQIGLAFKRGFPAVVSSHRVNYVGGRDPNNRDRSLNALKTLLKKVVKTFGDVTFMSSDELLGEMRA